MFKIHWMKLKMKFETNPQKNWELGEKYNYKLYKT